MSEKLRPCECGNQTPVIVSVPEARDNRFRIQVSCVFCGVRSQYSSSEAGAVSLWNNRRAAAPGSFAWAVEYMRANRFHRVEFNSFYYYMDDHGWINTSLDPEPHGAGGYKSRIGTEHMDATDWRVVEEEA